MENRLRLAPSPTGLFHIGTARTALFNWLYAKKNNGKFFIRIEDTDKERSKDVYTKNILEGLQWLGLDWDEEIIYQSKRIENHKEVIKILLDKGLAYRCFTTEEEIRELRDIRNQKNLPPKHDNRHRDLSKQQIEEYISKGLSSVIRFKIDDDIEICWEDKIRGLIKWQGKDLGGDMVLSRRAFGHEIGHPLYNLAVVVDDNFMRISHVVRGEDHISNTAKQILIYKALNFKLPFFAHTPLILNSEGKKLSKRDSVTSIDDFKKIGYLPEALNNYMSLLGWSLKSSENEILSVSDIAYKFDLIDVNKAGAKFSWEKLNWINSQHIKKMEIIDLNKLFNEYWKKKAWEVPSYEWGLKLTKLLQDSINVLNDVLEQSEPFFTKLSISKEGKDYLEKDEVRESLKLILEQIKNSGSKNIESNSAKNILKEISTKHNIKKGTLMKSLRVALFGSLSGPDLIQSWELFSETNSDIERINKCLSVF